MTGGLIEALFQSCSMIIIIAMIARQQNRICLLFSKKLGLKYNGLSKVKVFHTSCGTHPTHCIL